MLILRRARLVNWHFFTDATVEFGPMTLLAGDNGTGKSTIIDAVQYALVAQVSRIRFNAAASDRRAARTLDTYARCRIGADAVDYLRGDCLSHVILEFGDEDRSFCAGILIEAFLEGDARESLWILESGTLSDISIFDNNAFIAPRVFRDQVKQLGGVVCATKREYNNRLTHLLGVHRRNAEFNPYLEAVVRSVSFTPFTSVNDFVCDYILEEHNVDVGAMKENLQNYRAAEAEALAVERKIEHLAEVQARSDAVADAKTRILRQEYLQVRLHHEQAAEQVTQTRRELDLARQDHANTTESLHQERERRERLDAQRQEITFALAEDPEHRRFERLRRDWQETQLALEAAQARAERRARLFAESTELLGRSPGEDLAAAADAVATEQQQATREQVEAETEREALTTERAELSGEIDDLEAGLLRHPEAAARLKSALADAGIPAAHFADQLELTDETWHNAVEAWLDRDRFNLLVPRDDYARAVEVYREQPPEVAGVGLPEMAAIGDPEAAGGSLYEVVEAASPAARRYAAYLLGDVVRADPEDLRRHRRATTADCLQHRDAAVRRAARETSERWYIGRTARERRMNQIRERRAEIDTRLRALTRRAAERAERLQALARVQRNLATLAELAGAREQAERLAAALAEIEQRLAAVDTTSFEVLRAQIQALSESLAAAEASMQELTEDAGALRERVRMLEMRLAGERSEAERRTAAYDGFVADHVTAEPDLVQYYLRRVGAEREAGTFTYEDFFRRYDSAYQGLRTRLENARRELRTAKDRYNHAFNAVMELEEDEARTYRNLLVRLRETELPEFRDRIARAREDAERQFRDHFVARLNEHLIDAREAFAEINNILRTIAFGTDQYRFTIQQRPEKQALLSAIATAAEVREVEGTLFESLKSDAERESIEHLFAQILTHDTDDPASREICDYRRYFHYDIRIRHTEQTDEKTGAPLESSLSRVLREKSGGETQTPYYVAIAASFFRFYKESPAAVRLVLFDEAFNKMDDDRIGKTVSFFRKLSMQVVTAVPTEKLESIAPHMDRTNLVLRKSRNAFVRDYQVLPEPVPAGSPGRRR
jgi:uncharacterized protein YPO0396